MTSSISFLAPNYGLQIGNNYGLINAQFHLPPDDSGPLDPLSTVPFERDPDYVEQELLLGQVQEICSQPAARLALVGLGGIGKSQIAIEHSYRVRDKSPETWVFWIHASNAARFEQSYRMLAERVKIPARVDPNANIFRMVHDWLQDPRHGPWIMILDNLDSDEFLHKTPALLRGSESEKNGAPNVPLSTFLPRCPHGSIILTTRSNQIAGNFVSAKNIIAVEPDEAHAVALMRRKLGITHGEEEDVSELVKALDSMPLAIVQAAAYITKRAPRCSVSQYLEEFQKSDRKRSKLLDYEAGNLHRDWEAKSSILVTWQLSFDHIRETRKSAADLLSLMSFFDRQGIPEIVLRGSSNENSEESSSECDQSFEFEDDIQTLRDYSFISVSQDPSIFQMHALVQTAVQRWLNVHDEKELWKKQYIENLLQAFPQDDLFGNWQKCYTLFPHVQTALSQRPEGEADRRTWALLLRQGAEWADENRMPQETLDMATKAKDEFERLIGPESPEALSCSLLEAAGWMLMGRFTEAEKRAKQLLQVCERVHGKPHYLTMKMKSQLAILYTDQARLQEAEKLWKEIFETRQQLLGENHPSTLTAKRNLGIAYTSQEEPYINRAKFRKGLEMLTEVVDEQRKKYDEDHPEMLVMKASITSAYIQQGRLKEAEEMELKQHQTLKNLFGDEHQLTIYSVVKLGTIYSAMNRVEDAIPYAEESVEIFRKTLGDNNPSTIMSMRNLSIMYGRLDRFEEAAALAKPVYEARKEFLGENHPETIEDLHTLAMAYEGLGREEAKDLHWKVTKARVSAYRSENRRKLGVHNVLSLVAKGAVSAIDRFA